MYAIPQKQQFKDFKAVLDLACHRIRNQHYGDGWDSTKQVKLGMYDILQMPLAWVYAPSE